MCGRIIATTAFLLFAVAAFLGFAPGGGITSILFGILFLVLAVVTWRGWHIITTDYEAAVLAAGARRLPRQR